MRKSSALAAAILFVVTGACSRNESRHAQKNEPSAQPTAQPRAETRTQPQQAPVAQAKQTAEQAWQSAWRAVTTEGKNFGDAGEYALERTRDGAVRAYRKTERVAGGAGMKLEDTAIKAEVKAKLVANPETKASKIEVRVDRGKVRLMGRVATQREASSALRTALEAKGVKEVTSHLTWK